MIPDLTVLWVVFFVLLLTAIVNRLLFRPLLRVLQEREAAVTTARKLAEEAAERARTATAEFEARTAAARAEVYAEMDKKRRLALDERAALLARTRQEADEALTAAKGQLGQAAQEARARLERDAEALGGAIVDRVLDRGTS